MITTTPTTPVARSGTFSIGGTTPVNRLGYGAMQLTGEGVWGDPRDPDEAVRVLRRAVELGVTFIDTADSYGPFVTEELIRKALPPRCRWPSRSGSSSCFRTRARSAKSGSPR